MLASGLSSFNKAATSMLVPCLLLASLLTGCASTGVHRDRFYDRDTLDVITTAPDSKAVFLKEKLNSERFCLSPPADFASTKSDVDEVNVGSGLGAVKGGVNVGTTQGAMSLGGRDPAILLTREFLYRACEMTTNINADAATTRAIYKDMLQTIERLVVSGALSGAGSPQLAANPNLPAFKPVEVNSGQQGASATGDPSQTTQTPTTGDPSQTTSSPAISDPSQITPSPASGDTNQPIVTPVPGS